MQDQKIKTYIGFAIRSNSIVFGADTVVNARKKIYLVAVADDINETAYKRTVKKCEKESIILLRFEKGKISELTHRENCKCIGILDKNLSDAIYNGYNC